MKRLALALVAAGLLTLSAPTHAQDWAKARLDQSPRHGEYVTLTEASGHKLQAWVVYPEVKDKAPVVVMIHEIYGLSDWAREMADEVAGAGYIVVEPDLLSGFGPATKMGFLFQTKPETLSCLGSQLCRCATAPYCSFHGSLASAYGQVPAKLVTAAYAPQDHNAMHTGGQQNTGAAYVPANPGGTAAFPDQSAVVHAVSSLPDAQVLADLNAAADYGKHLPSANGKLYVAGFCWGGGKSFLFATQRKDLSAAFVFYGTPPPADSMKNITAPIYGFYAGNDARVTATVPQTEADMKAAGKTYVPKIYDGAGHGFMRAGEAPDASAPDTAARSTSFHRLIDLLGGIR